MGVCVKEDFLGEAIKSIFPISSFCSNIPRPFLSICLLETGCIHSVKPYN